MPPLFKGRCFITLVMKGWGNIPHRWRGVIRLRRNYVISVPYTRYMSVPPSRTFPLGKVAQHDAVVARHDAVVARHDAVVARHDAVVAYLPPSAFGCHLP